MQIRLFLELVFFCILFSLIFDTAYGFIEFKKYKVINSPKVCGDKLCLEIDEQRSKMGLSTRDIKVCGDRPCYEIIDIKAKTINKDSPHGQFESGIALDLIKCKVELQIIVRTSNLYPACVTQDTAHALRDSGWAISEQDQKKLFNQINENRKATLATSSILTDSDASLEVTSDLIYGKRFLVFEGDGWHRLHNVEITITGDTFSTSIRTKTDDKGHLYMPWPVPDTVGGRFYHIFATDGIHGFEMKIPITAKDNILETSMELDKCFTITFPIDWSDCNLYGRILSSVDLRMANLQNANLFGATLVNKDLTGTDFSGASLKKANLDGAILIGANLSYTNMVDSKIREADLSYAQLKFAKLYRTDLTGSNLTNANLEGATLSFSILSFTDLRGANLAGAGTWSANLNHCVNHPICE